GREPALHLAAVTYYEPGEDGPERLEADAFDLDVDLSSRGLEVIYRHYPGGEIRHQQRPFKLVPFRGGQRAVPITDADIEPALPHVLYADIVALWLQILARPRSTPL